MKKLSKKIKGIIAVTLLTATLSVGGLWQTATIAGSDVRDNFTFPETIDKTGVVGEKTSIAKIVPSAAISTDYLYKVILADTNEEIATDGYSFLPEKAGVYKCLYHYRTLEGEVCEYSYFIDVTTSNSPVFVESPVFPTAFLAGKTYQLPQVDAADWSSGSKQVATVTTTVKVDGEEMPVSNGSVALNTQGFSTAEIVYTATVGGKTETITVDVPVVDINTTIMDDGDEKKAIDTSALFITRGFDESVTYYEDEKVAGLSFFAVGDAQASFVNVLGAEGLSVDFGFGSACAAESLVYTVESYEDPSVYLTLEFKKGKQNEGQGEVILNGDKETAFTYTEEQSINVTFNNRNARFFNGTEELFSVVTDANGNPFTGFKNGKVKISFAVKNAYGETEFRVYKVNNQRMGVTRDNGDPDMFIGDFSGECTIGEEVKVVNRFAVDVIDPCATLKTSLTYNAQPVKDIHGNTITNVLNGEEIVFKPEKSGTYTLIFNVEDAAGRTTSRRMIITVYDNVTPVLTVDGDVKTSVSVGDTLTLPSAIADDNGGAENTQIQICVVWPTGKMKQIMLGAGKVEQVKFDDFTVSGEYIVRYVATDTDGNQTTKEFKITCGD